jgi:probable FeS assembly SUF system protein SufT
VTVNNSDATVELRRDCEATVIPGGDRMTLRCGDRVRVTQALGGSFTLTTNQGYLVRIGALDADALGLEPATAIEQFAPLGVFDRDQVIEQLKAVFDPEIPVNVVDLGLIYSCEAQSLPDGGHRVDIKMSMTAPGCGMGDVLREDAINVVLAIPGVNEVDVELVWDPPWNPSLMSDAALLELGML